MTTSDATGLPWNDDAREILERHAPPELRDQLRGEIEHLAHLRGEDRVTVETLLSLEELLTGP